MTLQQKIDAALVEAGQDPAQWQLVPKKATEEMIDAAIAPYRYENTKQFDEAMRTTVAGYYRAMLSASPKATP